MDEPHDDAPERRSRFGIYLLPNLFTTGTLFSGFFATLAAIEGEYISAVVAVFLGMLCDALDGRVARLTNTQSDFGKEYDSLADMVCFGFAPALVMYLWSLHELADYGRYGKQLAWTAAFFYAAMAALRLARFNVLAARNLAKDYFYGLPSPSAAALTMGYVWVVQDAGFDGEQLVFLSLLVTVAAGVLMVSSRIRYPSFKDIKLRERVPFRYVLAMVLALLALMFYPPGLFLIFLVYIVYGPIAAFRDRRRARAALGKS
ncbi:MAG TPA: CDP-diacylglycerol--serine O-phosphatidyltransferase [Nevskiales bacterium]|nr:CDP-diacylglycerol--serine O-phosphatidyltransferase [Nevskiales bacterium]